MLGQHLKMIMTVTFHIHSNFLQKNHSIMKSYITYAAEEPALNNQIFNIATLSLVLVLPLTENHAMKAYWGSGGTAPPIL
jgi:hypothetical protein